MAQEEVFPEIINDLLSYDDVKHKHVLDKYFAEDAVLIHPLLTTQGTPNIRRVFRVWSSLNALEPTIVESYVLDGQTAVVHSIQNFNPRIFPFLHLKVPAITTLKYRYNPDRGIEIYSQQDNWTLEGLIQSVPMVNWWYQNIVRVLLGKLFTGADSFIQTANLTTAHLTTHAGQFRIKSSEAIAPYQAKAQAVISPYSEQATKFVAPYSATAINMINEGQRKVQGISASTKAFVQNAQEEVKAKIYQVRGVPMVTGASDLH